MLIDKDQFGDVLSPLRLNHFNFVPSLLNMLIDLVLKGFNKQCDVILREVALWKDLQLLSLLAVLRLAHDLEELKDVGLPFLKVLQASAG